MLSFANARTAILLGLLLSGCAAPNGFSLFSLGQPSEPAPPPAAEESGACASPEKCAAQLKKLVSDPKRDWIGQPQSADAYANGTRLFAYRALRKKLNCGELKRALEDTSAAGRTLQTPGYERAHALTTAVGKELKAEQDSRCRSRT